MANHAQVAPGVCPLAFNNIEFQVVDRNGHPWLRVHQIGEALEYKNPERSATNLFNANAAEFTESMTALVELDTPGGRQQVRIFSLRGAHLLGMFARTKKAAEFRHWVLDILDRQPDSPLRPVTHSPKALPPPEAAPMDGVMGVLVELLRREATGRLAGLALVAVDSEGTPSLCYSGRCYDRPAEAVGHLEMLKQVLVARALGGCHG